MPSSAVAQLSESNTVLTSFDYDRNGNRTRLNSVVEPAFLYVDIVLVILTAHTWVLWGKHRRIGIILFATVAIVLVATNIFISLEPPAKSCEYTNLLQ